MNADRLRATLLAGVEAEAEATVSAAELRAAEEVERACGDSERLQEHARAEGEVAAELESTRALALARSRARRIVLEARQAVYEDFCAQALAAALALRADRKAYERLLGRLEATARRTLGDGAEVELDPAGVGGVRARAGRRSVDLTLPTLVDRCVAALGTRVEELWR